MSRECYLTGKKNLVVNSVIRRGKARADGGVGRKTTGITKRVQRANLHKKAIREKRTGQDRVAERQRPAHPRQRPPQGHRTRLSLFPGLFFLGVPAGLPFSAFILIRRNQYA